MDGYGISLTGRYYGIFSKKQARKRVRKINLYIKRVKKSLGLLRRKLSTGSGVRSLMRAGARSRDIHKIARLQHKLRNAQERRKIIRRRWALGGRKRKQLGYKLFKFG